MTEEKCKCGCGCGCDCDDDCECECGCDCCCGINTDKEIAFELCRIIQNFLKKVKSFMKNCHSNCRQKTFFLVI